MSEPVVLTLTAQEATVLFEWLAREGEALAQTCQDQAEQRVLWDIESALEPQLAHLFSPNYSAVVDAARDAVRDSTQ